MVGTQPCPSNLDVAAHARTGTAAHCSARQVEEYIESYVDHFDLRRHFRLNTTVERICREGDDGQWRLDLKGQPSQLFDKVLLATGPHVKPTMPKIEGSESFTGRIIHSKAFKRFAARPTPAVVSTDSLADLMRLPE